MIRLLALLVLLVPSIAFAADEQVIPDDTQSHTSSTCTTDPTTGAHAQLDNDPASAPDANWCDATGNNVNMQILMNFADPSVTLDTGTDAQVVTVWVEEFQAGQTGTAAVELEILDGTNCADPHETTPEQDVLTTVGGHLLTFNWSTPGISGKNDICIRLVCNKSGGSPGARQTCNFNAIEWLAVEAAGGGSGRRRPVFVIQP